MVSEHTAKAFDSDLQELTRLVAEMGGLAERMVTDSVDALVRLSASSIRRRSCATPTALIKAASRSRRELLRSRTSRSSKIAEARKFSISIAWLNSLDHNGAVSPALKSATT